MASLPHFKYDGDEIWPPDVSEKLWWWEDKAEKRLRQQEKRRKEAYRDDATERLVSSSEHDQWDSESLNREQYVASRSHGVMQGYKDLLSKPIKNLPAERKLSLSLFINFLSSTTISIRIPLDLFPLVATLGDFPSLKETPTLSLIITPHVLVDLETPRSLVTADYVEYGILPHLPTHPRVANFFIELDKELSQGEVNVSSSIARWEAARLELQQASLSSLPV